MAGKTPQASRRVTPSIPKKRFTLEQANRALPLVGRVVRDVQSSYNRAQRLQDRIASLSDRREIDSAQAELANETTRLQDYAAELDGIGCELKDVETGLVDFTGRHDGRDVLLCWTTGEPRIGFWHEVNSDVDSRRPVDGLHEDE